MKNLLIFEDYNRNFKQILDLEKYLTSFKIPIDKWGKGYAKTTEHLLWEIESGECNLIEKNGYLVREIEFVMCEIYYSEGEKTYKLIEEKQVFKDGRVRRRDKKSSVSEKMKIGEDPLESLIRGIEEELSISVDAGQIQIGDKIEKEDISDSFPGLITKYNGYNFTCFLNKFQYDPTGYQEKQKDKSTYFTWAQIDL